VYLDDPEKLQHSFYFSSFPIFLPFTFLLFSYYFSFFHLYSSVYNLFALVGRKATFTHSTLRLRKTFC